MPAYTEAEPILKTKPSVEPWKGYEKISFRIAFIFFFLLTVPTDIDYYKGWFTTDWEHLHIRDLGKLAGSSFAPFKIQENHPGEADRGSLQEKAHGFFVIQAESGNFGLASYVNWGVALLIGIFGGLLWTLLDRKPRNYQVLYYFLIVAVSYSMLIRLEGLTFSKVFPTQMPALAETQLNTNLGDFTHQKLYWIQLSFVHNYETFIGLAELAIMLLLFFRKTRALGAAMALFMIGNIAIANHVYDGGIHLAAAFYALGGTFVLWRYIPEIWNLLVNEKDTAPQVYYFPFEKKWQQYLRIGLKTAVFGLFFLTSGYLHWHNYKTDSYKVPSRPGLANSRGVYQVSEFKVNNKVIPYSPIDSIRWQTVTFEKWSTISFAVNNTFRIHGEAGRGKQFKDVDRTYESAGTGGGRRHYYYEADTVKQTLHLFNKNKVYKEEELFFTYERPTDTRIVLRGQNEFKDSVYVVLDKVTDKIYPLYEARNESAVWIP
ncbi:hypothetical protein [Cytophaga hutchinsonii]|uniref:Uncharacterized protein n=1 Tax=Cytophaga hutchinsonii (strain ATCC 33406 / DSM 1761 / CIP 103989 / NBRC 15051 / NCIMB 9469 / D465) TaxID=269798 RepID=A0A6N4SNH6_CYTH3|nr:hypothetical protein [Cytophaga hutchinsonii]ABG57844.1 conserved hypothetical protein [Cytophaga hutchinsonii ATCC 33406]SFX07162.1 hypothetical protein SAMN04487930_101398 [Cytophaga hutchinsonii ATCC 33406]